MRADDFSGGGWAIPSHRIQTGVIRSNNWPGSCRDKLRKRADRKRPDRVVALKKKLFMSAFRRRLGGIESLLDVPDETILIKARDLTLVGEVSIADIISDQSVAGSADLHRNSHYENVRELLAGWFVKLRVLHDLWLTWKKGR